MGASSSLGVPVSANVSGFAGAVHGRELLAFFLGPEKSATRRRGARTRCAQTRAPLRPPGPAVLGSLHGWLGRRRLLGVERERKSKAFALCATSFCFGKRKQNRFRRDASRCDGAASVPCAPRPGRHGAQTRFAQTRAPLWPLRPAVLGSLCGSVEPSAASRSQNQSRSKNSESRSRSRSRSTSTSRSRSIVSAGCTCFSAVALPSRKASRAPQTCGAAEAPLSERSEFGRRAPPVEEHREPMRLLRVGSCQAPAVLVPFAKTKGTRAKRESFWRRPSATSLSAVPPRPRSTGHRCGSIASARVRRKLSDFALRARPSGRLRRSLRFAAQWFLLPRQKELAQSAKAFAPSFKQRSCRINRQRWHAATPAPARTPDAAPTP
jgi:hypothetical protein